jgi:pyruvate/2-oxoglutarate dehydrogenase complex dihydrolipoamide dehydrogenase (E3) component
VIEFEMDRNDEHNARLIEHVHPPAWVNPTPAPRYNLVVIGAGTAGLVTAAGAAGLGAKVALVERDLMGGDCLNVGCVPSKALIAAARAAASMGRASEFGISNATSESARRAATTVPSPQPCGERARVRGFDAETTVNGGESSSLHSSFLSDPPPEEPLTLTLSPQSRGEGTGVNFARVMERLRSLRADIASNDSAARFQSLGVDVFLGEGRFTGPDTIEVAGQTLRFKKAVIATGARATHPDTPGLAEAGYLTNETVFNLTELPPRLAVIGGGPIGCELAQAFARLGSQVTLIVRSHQLLAREDEDAARIVQASLERDGVHVLLDAVVEREMSTLVPAPASSRVAAPVPSPFPSPPSSGERARVRGPDCDVASISEQPAERRTPHPNPLPSKARGEGTGTKTIFVRRGGETIEVTADEILVGAGRTPNVEGLNLEAVGVRHDRENGVVVDDRLRTTNPRIFAAGDVCSPFKFTHAADFMARIVIQNALFFGRAKASALTIPWCTYTSPEVAHVGLTESGAKELGIKVRAFVQGFQHVDRAILEGSTDGFVKILVKSGTDRIVGATIVAEHAGEMIGEIVLAMQHRIGLGRLASTIHPYPTVAEAIRKCGDAYNRTRLTPFVKRLFERWLAWTR